MMGARRKALRARQKQEPLDQEPYWQGLGARGQPTCALMQREEEGEMELGRWAGFYKRRTISDLRLMRV
jgi:hypothetical protein